MVGLVIECSILDFYWNPICICYLYCTVSLKLIGPVTLELYELYYK